MTKISPHKIIESHKDEKGRHHRTDGPAVVKHSGEQRWYLNGKLHRDGGAAVIVPDSKSEKGYQMWYRHGKRHREDGPAEIFSYQETWFRNDIVHRADGPANTIWHDHDGAKARIRREQWIINGTFGREDGPAETEYSSTTPGHIVCETWIRDGFKHREDGPAVIFYSADGVPVRKQWYRKGQMSRVDGPAYEDFIRGELYEQRWYFDGQLHRADGPATIRYENGIATDKIWYHNGKIDREDGPAIMIDRADHFREEWQQNGRLIHRDDLPVYHSIDKISGVIEKKWYFTNGDYRLLTDSTERYRDQWFSVHAHHREDGPASTYIDRRTGKTEYFWAYRGTRFSSATGEMPENFPTGNSPMVGLDTDTMSDLMIIAGIIENNPALKKMNQKDLIRTLGEIRKKVPTEETVGSARDIMTQPMLSAMMAKMMFVGRNRR